MQKEEILGERKWGNSTLHLAGVVFNRTIRRDENFVGNEIFFVMTNFPYWRFVETTKICSSIRRIFTRARRIVSLGSLPDFVADGILVASTNLPKRLSNSAPGAVLSTVGSLPNRRTISLLNLWYEMYSLFRRKLRCSGGSLIPFLPIVRRSRMF